MTPIGYFKINFSGGRNFGTVLLATPLFSISTVRHVTEVENSKNCCFSRLIFHMIEVKIKKNNSSISMSSSYNLKRTGLLYFLSIS